MPPFGRLLLLSSRTLIATTMSRRSTRLMSAATHTNTSVPTPPPTLTKAEKKMKKATANTISDIAENLTKEAPKKRQRKPSTLSEEDEGDEFVDTKPKKKRAKKAKDPAVEGEAKPKRQRKPKPEPVYVIPDVETRETTFRGRLGYACLNTILRKQKPPVFCSRTCRIDTIKKNGLDFVKDLGRQNTEDLLALIQWNEDNNIRFMRISSELFPFASHGEYGYSLSYCAPLLAKVGELAKKYNHRLTTHPGQFNQLGSPRPSVIEGTVRDLTYHCEMLDLMGQGKDGVMIIHGGGTFGDKAATIERIKENLRAGILPKNVLDRVVLENDELGYSAEDLLPICEEFQIPLVFDYHHDCINPSSIPPSEIIARANKIFEARGIKPKQHLSEPRPGAETIMERRAHANRCQTLPADLPVDMDLMIEAKDKEQAVLHLYRIYGLQPVVQASLRPPAEHETKETNGRKSNKRAAKAKAKAAAEEEERNEQDEDEDVDGEFAEIDLDEAVAVDPGSPLSPASS